MAGTADAAAAILAGATVGTSDLEHHDQIKSFRDFLLSYNKLSELCFSECVWDLTSRKVKDTEDKCALNCAEKYLKMNQRVSQRFQEFQIMANETAVAAMQKQAA